MKNLFEYLVSTTLAILGIVIAYHYFGQLVIDLVSQVLHPITANYFGA